MRPDRLIALCLLCFSPALLAGDRPSNIIIMIGDGMGPAHLTAYRHFQYRSDDPAQVPNTIYDDLLVGLSGTHPDDDTIVTDSASSATALATGYKTCNQFVALSCEGKPLRTLFQEAKARSMRTGLAVSSQVNHATPAAYYAHQKSRHDYDQIADQLLDNRVDDQLPVDIIFGGGTDYFLREDRNLVTELESQGYQYADNWEAFGQLDEAPALALLADVALPAALNNPVESPLAQLTDKALQLLTNDEGFVLMVEGSQIDWCSHDNDVVCMLGEMHDFAEAVRVARGYVDAHPDTLLLITADHETGGLSLGRDGHYAWEKDVLRGVTLTARALGPKMHASADDQWETIWNEHTGIALEDRERARLGEAHAAEEEDLIEVIKAVINERSYTGWTTGGHSAVDVPVMAYGQGRESFIGYLDNAEIGQRLMKLLP